MLLLSLLLSIRFAIFTQPLTMGLIIIIQTILIAFITFTYTKLSWYSLILVIVIAGALLITFIYVAVLIPAEPHARRSLWSLPVILPPAILLIISAPSNLLINLTTTLPTPLFYKSSIPITLILVSLLLLALLIVVHNTYYLKGPMRSY